MIPFESGQGHGQLLVSRTSRTRATRNDVLTDNVKSQVGGELAQAKLLARLDVPVQVIEEALRFFQHGRSERQQMLRGEAGDDSLPEVLPLIALHKKIYEQGLISLCRWWECSKTRLTSRFTRDRSPTRGLRFFMLGVLGTLVENCLVGFVTCSATLLSRMNNSGGSFGRMSASSTGGLPNLGASSIRTKSMCIHTGQYLLFFSRLPWARAPTKGPPWVTCTNRSENPFCVAYLPVRLSRLREIRKLLVAPVLESLVGPETNDRDQSQNQRRIQSVDHGGQLGGELVKLPQKVCQNVAQELAKQRGSQAQRKGKKKLLARRILKQQGQVLDNNGRAIRSPAATIPSPSDRSIDKIKIRVLHVRQG